MLVLFCLLQFANATFLLPLLPRICLQYKVSVSYKQSYRVLVSPILFVYTLKYTVLRENARKKSLFLRFFFGVFRYYTGYSCEWPYYFYRMYVRNKCGTDPRGDRRTQKGDWNGSSGIFKKYASSWIWDTGRLHGQYLAGG